MADSNCTKFKEQISMIAVTLWHGEVPSVIMEESNMSQVPHISTEISTRMKKWRESN